MSSSGTAQTTAANRSGRCVDRRADQQAAVGAALIAPAAPAWSAFASTRYSAAAMKSSKTFCLFASMPARCHASPYSPPPRRLATAYTPPGSSHASVVAENAGVQRIWKPP